MSKSPIVFRLTTTDNRYNPFTQWINWYLEDLRLGHDTCGLLSRNTASSDMFEDYAEQEAMRDIVTNNFSGKHILVTEKEFDSLIKILD